MTPKIREEESLPMTSEFACKAANAFTTPKTSVWLDPRPVVATALGSEHARYA